jgi:hypothetical protein
MHGPGPVRDRLDDIQLVQQPPPGRHFCKMLCFIDQHDAWPTVAQRLLHSMMILSIVRPAARHEIDGRIAATGSHVSFSIDQRFVHLIQHPPEMIAPVEVAGRWRDGLDCRSRKLGSV